jgi:hypothetical protein
MSDTWAMTVVRGGNDLVNLWSTFTLAHPVLGWHAAVGSSHF